MRIICATDFSPAARAAADTAVRLAAKLSDRVLLVHVIDPVSLLGMEMTTATTTWEATVRQAAERELDAEIQRLQGSGVGVLRRVVLGRPVGKIQELVAEEDTRLVVVGSHGRRGTAHFFLGSVAEKIASESRCPVLVTRGLPYPADGLTGQRRLHLMLLADGTPGAEAALHWIKSLRAVLPCDVTFLQTYWTAAEEQRFGLEVGSERSPEAQPLRELLERELRRWVGTLPGAGDVRFCLRAAHGKGTEELAFEAELRQPDLVVTGIAQRGTRPAGGTLPAPALLQALKLPVVCVPESLRPRIDGRIPVIRTVLVGTDLSDFSNQIVPAAYALLLGTGGRVEICHVFERTSTTGPAAGLVAVGPLDAGERSRLEAKLASLTPPEAARLGITTGIALVEAEAAAAGLFQEAERVGADVVVVASHGRTGIKRALMGSVSSLLVERASRPVLVLHPPRV
jgi:nucleotide-binding universal stress UspA family protein